MKKFIDSYPSEPHEPDATASPDELASYGATVFAAAGGEIVVPIVDESTEVHQLEAEAVTGELPLKNTTFTPETSLDLYNRDKGKAEHEFIGRI